MGALEAMLGHFADFNAIDNSTGLPIIPVPEWFSVGTELRLCCYAANRRI
ncbi:MAG: hypothetical protein V1879_02200 [Pseudomonadota bacterium]